MRTKFAIALGCVATSVGVAELPAYWDELMGTRVVQWEELESEAVEGAVVREYFEAPTSTLLDLGLRATTLDAGGSPHPARPHTRKSESVLIVKEGSLEVQLDEKKMQLTEGSAVFLGPNQWHALRNAGTVPVTYYELDWVSPGMHGESPF